MNGKSSKFTYAALSALLYTQGLLIVAGVALAVMKDRAHADATFQPLVVAVAASPATELR